MPRLLTGQLAAHIGEPVEVAGWVQSARHLSNVVFLLLRDRGGLVQIVVDAPDLMAAAGRLVAETVVVVEGQVVASDEASGGRELRASSIRVISPAVGTPPINLRPPRLREQLPTVLDNAPIALRHTRERAKFQIAAASMRGFRETLGSMDFTEVQTPKIVATDTEGEERRAFAINYLGRHACLAESPQLYKQVMVAVFERVFEVGPVFRAEPHDTPRHLAEYVSLDAEIAFIEDHRSVMRVVRDVVAGMTDAVRAFASDSVALLGVDLPSVYHEIPTVLFWDAQRMLEVATGERVVGRLGLSPAHERWLGNWAKTEHGSDFVFVSGYPMGSRPFYTHPDPERPGFSNSFDLLMRGVEVTTGGQRLHLYEELRSAVSAANANSLAWYEPSRSDGDVWISWPWPSATRGRMKSARIRWSPADAGSAWCS